jgi:hypothetical protein
VTTVDVDDSGCGTSSSSSSETIGACIGRGRILKRMSAIRKEAKLDTDAARAAIFLRWFC